ncbi:hypothetical protein ACFZDG_18570 [Kitasatospora xanthocidica]|uniref:hypothetical protein n=1 Tax=Kitasatospora xanthocidica TaxID=83382 RepID=UPI0036EA427A
MIQLFDPNSDEWQQALAGLEEMRERANRKWAAAEAEVAELEAAVNGPAPDSQDNG